MTTAMKPRLVLYGRDRALGATAVRRTSVAGAPDAASEPQVFAAGATITRLIVADMTDYSPSNGVVWCSVTSACAVAAQLPSSLSASSDAEPGSAV